MKNIAYEIAKSHGYDRHQRKLASYVYRFFDDKSGSWTRATSKVGISVNEQLAEKLHKSVTKKFKRRKLYARFKHNIWAADLAEMESLSLKNKNVKYLLCVTVFFPKYASVRKIKMVKQF